MNCKTADWAALREEKKIWQTFEEEKNYYIKY